MQNIVSFAVKNPNKAVFVGMHLLLPLLFFVPITGTGVFLCVAFYYVRMFGITAGYHRGLSHRSYKSWRWVTFVLAWLGCSAMQRGPLWWAATHRDHHKHSDTPEDPHSPIIRGFFHAHIGWVLWGQKEHPDFSRVSDLAKCPELRWLEKFHWVPGLSMLFLTLLIGGLSGAIWGSVFSTMLSAAVWGFVLSTVLLYHGTFLINSVCHLFGTQRFKTKDLSRNNAWVAIFATMGEGWHNNHHHLPSRARQGLRWWELDLSFYLLWVLSIFGCVWDLRKPPPKALEK